MAEHFKDIENKQLESLKEEINVFKEKPNFRKSVQLKRKKSDAAKEENFRGRRACS